MNKKFDLKTIYHRERPLSWSAISSFGYNPKQWYEKYVAKIRPESSPEMDFGNYVDKKIQNDPTFLPEVIRYPIMQHEMRAVFDGIPLMGIADTFRPYWSEGPYDFYESVAIRDYKTGRNKWDQARADETGQLTLYTFFQYLNDKVKPEDVDLFIDWLPTCIHKGDIAFRDDPVKVFTFHTKRTMRDVLKFGEHIKKTWKEMEEYAARAADYHSDNMADW